MLKEAAHQHARIVGEHSLRTVSVMHVEVDDRQALDAMHGHGMCRTDRNIVEEAETHRLVRQRMMPRRPNTTEGRRGFPAHHRIDGANDCARCVHRGIERLGIHESIRIDRMVPFCGRHAGKKIEILLGVNPKQCLARHRLYSGALIDVGGDPTRQHLIGYRVQTRWALGVPRPHIVQPARRVCNIQCLHEGDYVHRLAFIATRSCW